MCKCPVKIFLSSIKLQICVDCGKETKLTNSVEIKY